MTPETRNAIKHALCAHEKYENRGESREGWVSIFEWLRYGLAFNDKQAGAELGQAQDEL